MLISELHTYNLSCSYDEVRRLNGLQDVNEGGLVEIIIDNYDAVISSQNCLLHCHYMAMLATQRKVDSKNLNSLDATILRLSEEQMKQHIP